ncbi:glycosyltransferase family 4 protein [Desulfohalobium retbaense]|uniref:Glycosyl transferase group 1 n=1 Tax=Desulfohalobium retbaense (strain ATCC 49708 / DSM 5692 / JCM 16813 / HR100) TaxID=485915 RepID=C8X068_DESRD|nr:glycosyltransferase family 4 protein [Desulfohalobium retbaense]ACV67693.1 glycosyl transferase group 1 [Desulfohalobium retbaense DSM 5692]
MNIVFLTDNFPPEVNAPATRGYEHCQEWIRQGARVTVITCAPNFPSGRVYPGYRNRLYRKEDMDGITVVRVWSYMAPNAGFARRVLDYASFAFTGFLAGIFHKADIVLTTSPQFFTNFAGLGLSVLKRRPWVFELRDLWPESIRTVGAMRESKVLDWLEAMELFFYRKASRVVAVTPAFKRNLVSRGIAAEKIEVVPNGANMQRFTPLPKDQALEAELGVSGKFVIAYIGTHGLAHSLEFIVRSVAQLPDTDVHFLFVGDGAEKERVVQVARELGVKNATFVPPVPKDQVGRYISVSDAALVPLIKAETFTTVIPSKIFESAAMRKPIILGVEGQAQEIVEEHGAGVCFEPENEADFLRQVRRLKDDPDLYAQLQNGCARLAREYDRQKLAGEMLQVLQKAIG